MKGTRIASWIFECVAGVLAAYSLSMVLWLLREVARDVVGPTLQAGPGGMPGNLGAGIGIAIWLGSGIVAAVLAYLIAVAASPDDRSALARRAARCVEWSAIVGFVAPFIIVPIGLLIT